MLASVSQEQLIPINNLRTSWIANSTEVLQKIQDVVSSGHWIHGPEHKAFESEFAAFLGVNKVIGVGSGSDALEIALMTVGCTNGSKVITVANAGGYTSLAATKIGCKLIYCDIEPDSMQIDPKKLDRLLSTEIDAVVVTHLFGNIAPVIEITEMCRSYGVPVIEDCAQAIGGISGGQRVGSLGDISVFSFYPTKNLGAMGDGGAIATNNSKYAEIARKLRQYGWGSKYRIDIPGGINSRLDEVQAAILRIGLKFVEDLNESRLRIVKEYENALQSSSIRLVTSTAPGNVAHLAVLAYKSEFERERSREVFAKHLIQTDIYYPILDSLQPGLPLSEPAGDLEVSISVGTRILSIPLFPGLREDEISRICKALSVQQ
jgi:aminotransferase EvaB